MSKNVHWHDGFRSLQDRRHLWGVKNKVLWFTGLSGSGKSTIAMALEKELHTLGIPSYVLDGDNIRHGLSADLSFSRQDKEENQRRITEVARLFYDAGLFVLVCFINPYRKGRSDARRLIGKDFVEIFVDCPLSECERRDAKGLYQKARRGAIPDFIGIHERYEIPVKPDIHLRTDRDDVAACVDRILASLRLRKTDRKPK